MDAKAPASAAGAINPSDQQRALWLSTLAFTTCFAVWTIFAIIGIQIKKTSVFPTRSSGFWSARRFLPDR